MPVAADLSRRSPRIVALSRLGDEALAGRAAAGSHAAFGALFERYHGPLLGYCRSILLDDEDAQDATQSALESALRALPRRQPGRPLRPWLYRIAHNAAIDVVRRRRPQHPLSERDEPTVPGPEFDAEQRLRLSELVDDLRALPERQRGALVMRELGGLGYDEIALALDVSPQAARRAVFDARTALHAAVDGRATECTSVRHCISDGDRRSARARRIRAHLRSCDDCASFQRAIGARSADLHLLAPWLPGAAIAGMLGGGAGSGALAAVGGGGAATVTVAGWSAIPVLVKGITVAAVVATTGTAAIDLRHAPGRSDPAPRTQAAQLAGGTAGPRPALRAATARTAAPGAPAARTRREARRRGAGATPTDRGTAQVPAATSPAAATTASPPAAPPPAGAPQHATAPAQSRPPAGGTERHAIETLTGVREQIAAALARAQAIADAGSASALRRAQATLQAALGSAGTTIERVAASTGLRLPAGATAPAPSAASSSPSAIAAPVQQVLDAVDAALTQLAARGTG